MGHCRLSNPAGQTLPQGDRQDSTSPRALARDFPDALNSAAARRASSLRVRCATCRCRRLQGGGDSPIRGLAGLERMHGVLLHTTEINRANAGGLLLGVERRSQSHS